MHDSDTDSTRMRGVRAAAAILCAAAMSAAGAIMPAAAAHADTGDAGGDTAATQTMWRLYNPNSGEHFYTASEEEHDNLTQLGWSDEGVG